MKLRFLDRAAEQARLRQAFQGAGSSFCCLYGRRRCGKSRLLTETLPARHSVYYVADEREAPLQRAAVAAAIERLLPGFGAVGYPDWDALLQRWWREAPAGAVLSLDEFPFLVRVSPELPSLLQKRLDEGRSEPLHLVLCGSAQRMMQGLVLDAAQPLYGRAQQILDITPLGAGWIGRALDLAEPRACVSAYAVWGGIPRYWELAAECPSLWAAVESLVLDPLGVLHQEPHRLLQQDMRDAVQAASILSLIGQGCHRVSELAGRLGKPATSLTRPLQRLMELRLVRRELPFGAAARSSKRTVYSIADPFLGFWYRHVDPNRSRLAAGNVKSVLKEVRSEFASWEGPVWERLAREAVPRLPLGGVEWRPAARWWGAGADGRPLELDIVAESADGKALFVGEAKLRITRADAPRIMARLRAAAERLPFAQRPSRIITAVFCAEAPPSIRAPGALVATAREVLDAIK